MMLHESGWKAERDRTILLASYRDMTKFFRVPRRSRLTTEQIAKMTNKHLKRACSDLYNGVTVKQATAYGIKRGLIPKPRRLPAASVLRRVLFWMKDVVYNTFNQPKSKAA
jgi:hypothetical protein